MCQTMLVVSAGGWMQALVCEAQDAYEEQSVIARFGHGVEWLGTAFALRGTERGILVRFPDGRVGCVAWAVFICVAQAPDEALFADMVATIVDDGTPPHRAVHALAHRSQRHPLQLAASMRRIARREGLTALAQALDGAG